MFFLWNKMWGLEIKWVNIINWIILCLTVALYKFQWEKMLGESPLGVFWGKDLFCIVIVVTKTTPISINLNTDIKWPSSSHVPQLVHSTRILIFHTTGIQKCAKVPHWQNLRSLCWSSLPTTCWNSHGIFYVFMMQNC